jgi:hypothetical protein
MHVPCGRGVGSCRRAGMLLLIKLITLYEIHNFSSKLKDLVRLTIRLE